VPRHGAAETGATRPEAVRPALKARSKQNDDYPTQQTVVKHGHPDPTIRRAAVD